MTVTVNDEGAPEAVDDSATTDEDTAVTIDITNNDSMIDGAELVADSVSDPANGSVVVNADGTVTYTPDQDFSGTDTFTYTIRDEDGETSTATVTVTVDDDGVPVAVDDSATTDEETAVTIDVKANDAWNDNATLTSTTESMPTAPLVWGLMVRSLTHRTRTLKAPIAFTYTLTDDNGDTSTATVTVTVNDEGAPEAVDDSATTDEDTAVDIAILSNDQMIDGAELVADSVSDPANGSVVVNADGTVTYTPDQDFSGTDTFTYTIRDEDGETSTANGNGYR